MLKKKIWKSDKKNQNQALMDLLQDGTTPKFVGYLSLCAIDAIPRNVTLNKLFLFTCKLSLHVLDVIIP
jgi:hypothetical protein